ncbi:MAG: aldose epimerase family protein [Bacteroidales bacterium]|nr:aldose epimerase family protein [Bacteroidales bacterium]
MSTKSGLEPKRFEAVVDGKNTALYVLENKQGAEMCVCNYGGIIVTLMMPDRNGNMDNVVLGLSNIDDMVKEVNPYLGAAIGRYGNRIANGKFSIDGVEYTLPQNNATNCLHGGLRGFSHHVWDAEQTNKQTLVLKYVSADGEEGFPGTLSIEMTYTLTDENEVRIDYKATTDKKTLCNLTNHSFFNLGGIKAETPSIINNVLTLNCDKYIPVDEIAIPFGEKAPVEGTPFDFRQPTVIAERIDMDDVQIKNGSGIDHSFCINQKNEGELTLAAVCEDPETGRVLKTYTTEPGLQVYSGNFLDGTIGVGNCKFPRRSGICFEAQHHPDCINQTNFEQCILAPGETYKQTTVYAFSTK